MNYQRMMMLAGERGARRCDLTAIMTIFMAVLPPSLQMRREIYESSSSESIRESYEFQDITSTRYHDISCSTNELLGYIDKKSTISWEVHNGRGHTQHGSKETLLVSTNISVRDAGNYTCTLTSSNGTIVRKTYVICVTKSERTENPPVKGTISPETYASKGAEVVFICKAYVGCPRCRNPYNYTARWSKFHENGNVLLLASADIIITESMKEAGIMEGQLQFKRVQSSHYGRYLCNITNEIGSLLQNVTLTNQMPPAMFRNLVLWIACGILLAISLVFPCLRCAYLQLKYYPIWSGKHSATDAHEYDVMLVNGPTSHPWVMEVLKPMLVDRLRYLCFLPECDMLGGEEWISCISEVVTKSRHVLIVETPCILEDPECIWAIKKAHAAERHRPATTFRIILQRIKKEDFREQQEAMNILCEMPGIKVPKCLHIKKPHQVSQEILTEVSQKVYVPEAKDFLNSKVMALHSGCLGPPSTGNCTLRFRSNSPKDQMAKNMTIGANNSLMASSFSDRDQTVVSERREGNKGPKGNGERENKDGDKKSKGNIKLGKMSNSDFKHEDLEDIPGTPCSHRRKTCSMNDLWKCFRALYVGDDEDLFWKAVRLKLLLPMEIPYGDSTIV